MERRETDGSGAGTSAWPARRVPVLRAVGPTFPREKEIFRLETRGAPVFSWVWVVQLH